MTVELTGIPVLETERLILRGPKPSDQEGYLRFMLSERSQYIGRAKTVGDAWRSFAKEFGHWAILGYGAWSVTMKGDDTCLGGVGCWYPEGWPAQELGWSLWEEAEGKGIAYEAAVAARDYAYGTLGWTTAVSYIDPANVRSIALAERLGCVLDTEAPRPEPDDLVYRHPSPEELS